MLVSLVLIGPALQLGGLALVTQVLRGALVAGLDGSLNRHMQTVWAADGGDTLPH